MITSPWAYLPIVFVLAGMFPAIERRTHWRIFNVLPPIVWTYLCATALAVAGVWTTTPDLSLTQKTLTTYLLPSLLFLLMVRCDLAAIVRLGPRVLTVFACAMASILIAIVLVYAAMRSWLPADAWKMLAALSATWTGGSANLVAVKQSIDMAEASLPPVLLTDALCYTAWVMALFSTTALIPAFNRWSRATLHARPDLSDATRSTARLAPASVLLWLAIAMLVVVVVLRVSRELPTAMLFTTTSWTALLATLAGLIAARTRLARIPGPDVIGSALLALLVAVLGSQSSFSGLAAVPVFLLCGATILVVHIALLAASARLFHFDVRLCAIASLAQIGGVGSAPILAAMYSPELVPVAVLLALLGLVLGTGIGLAMANLLATLAPTLV